ALEQCRVDRNCGRAEEQRVAVGRGTRHLTHADIAGGSTTIVDDHLLAKRMRDGNRENAGDDIGRPTRREGHHEGNGPVRIGRLSGRNQARQDARTGGSQGAPPDVFSYATNHVVPPWRLNLSLFYLLALLAFDQLAGARTHVGRRIDGRL